MKQKTVFVTGATNGLGKAIAENLAKQGADLVIVGRNEAKTKQVAQELQTLSHVRYYVADLSRQEDVKTLAKQVNHDLDRLDVLINNAGAWFSERNLSQDGIEMTWALNHLSYVFLTHELTALLKDTAKKYGEARIINQASNAHHEGKIHWDNLEFENNWSSEGKGSVGPGWAVYSQSKLANVMHAFALARQFEGSAVVANAIHPSTVVTGFTQNNGIIYKLAAPVRRLFNRRSVEYGAAPAIYLASSPEASKISGAYYGPLHQKEEVNPIANDLAAQDRLWEISMRQLGLADA